MPPSLYGYFKKVLRMKILYSYLQRCVLIVAACFSTVCLGADAVSATDTTVTSSTQAASADSSVQAQQPGSTAVQAETSQTTQNSTDQVVASQSSQQAASATPVAAEDAKAVAAQRAARHKQAEELAAQLVQKLNASLAAVNAAKTPASQQVPSVATSSEAQAQSLTLTTTPTTQAAS